MWAIKRNGKTILTTKEKPKFINGTLRHPIKAVDVRESDVTVEEVAVTLDEAKEAKKHEIKQAFMNASVNPIVDTPLGFKVNGEYNNKTDFETGKKYAFPKVRDADNVMHDVSAEDYDAIIQAIEMNGIALYQHKWELEAIIDEAQSISDLEVITW